MEVLIALIDLISKNFGYIFAALVIYWFRHPVTSILSRLKKFLVTHGDTSFELETTIEDQESETIKKLDRVSADEDEEQEGKQEETKDFQYDLTESRNWRLRFIGLLEQARFEEADATFEQAQEEQNDPIIKASNQGFYFYREYIQTQDTDYISKLREFIQSLDDEYQLEAAVNWLQTHYDSTNQKQKKIDLLFDAVKRSESATIITRYLCDIAYSLIELEKFDDAHKVISDRLLTAEDPEQKFLLYKALGEYFHSIGDGRSAALCAEKLAELRPDDPDELFKVAYRQSLSDLTPLVVNNYEICLLMEPDNSVSTNNLGVEANSLDFKGKAIRLFTESATEGNTLAMSNLALEYMKAGFYDDAERWLDEAIKQDEVHQNVWETKNQLNKKREKENKDWTEYTDVSQKLSTKFRELTTYAFEHQFEPEFFIGQWFLNGETEIDVEVQGRIFKAEWNEEGRSALGDALSANKRLYKATLIGQIQGRACFLSYERKRVDNNRTLLTAALEEKQIPMVGYVNNEGVLKLFSQNPLEKLSIDLVRVNYLKQDVK